MTDEQIHAWWASENGLEDCDMCKIDDFRTVVRAVEKKLGTRPAADCGEYGHAEGVCGNASCCPSALSRQAPAAPAEAEDSDGPLVDGWQISVSRGHSGFGVYAHMTEYPEEGAVFLSAIPGAWVFMPEAPAPEVLRELNRWAGKLTWAKFTYKDEAEAYAGIRRTLQAAAPTPAEQDTKGSDHG